jgi:hypothetical protein
MDAALRVDPGFKIIPAVYSSGDGGTGSDEEKNHDPVKYANSPVIKRIADKNIRLIPQFKEKHPDCIKSHSKYTDQYNKIIIESMGGPGDNDEEKEDKIIKNISKIITIDKE